jgi:two-component system, NarL family, invasion response regulator UvrY
MIRIAIIDDQKLFRQGFLILLEQLQYDISIEAANGDDFIEKITHDNTPDIILLDTQLKGMDSYSLLRWIKINYPNVPVIALHDKNDFHFMLQLLRAGAVTHLSKSATPAVVQRTIQEVVHLHSHR